MYAITKNKTEANDNVDDKSKDRHIQEWSDIKKQNSSNTEEEELNRLVNVSKPDSTKGR